MTPCLGKIPTSEMASKQWHKTDEMMTLNDVLKDRLNTNRDIIFSSSKNMKQPYLKSRPGTYVPS